MTTMSSRSKRARLADISFVIAFASASLWDFRLFDLRLFDGLALACLGVYFALSLENLTGFMLRRRNYWVLFSAIIFYAAVGYASYFHRSSLAILVLTIVGFALIGRREWLDALGAMLWPLVGIHMLFFFIQFGAFYGFQYVIDYQAALGGASRIMRSADHMRAAGLFQEPNSYCLNILVLASMAILARPSRPYALAAALTTLLSESLWGIGVSIVILLLNEMRLQESPRRFVIALIFSMTSIAIIANAYLWLGKSPSKPIPDIYARIIDILSDFSLRERYIQSTCALDERTVVASSHTAYIAKWTFGEGLSTQFFKECLPANGFAFLLKSFGVAGLVFLLVGFALALRGLSIGGKLYAAFAIGFSFTSYPLVTYVIFWLWLPTIINLLRLKRTEAAADIDVTAHR